MKHTCTVSLSAPIFFSCFARGFEFFLLLNTTLLSYIKMVLSFRLLMYVKTHVKDNALNILFLFLWKLKSHCLSAFKIIVIEVKLKLAIIGSHKYSGRNYLKLQRSNMHKTSKCTYDDELLPVPHIRTHQLVFTTLDM